MQLKVLMNEIMLFLLLAISANGYEHRNECNNQEAVKVSQVFGLNYHRNDILEKRVNPLNESLNSAIDEMNKIDEAMQSNNMTVSEKDILVCDGKIPTDCCQIKNMSPSAKSGIYTILDPCADDKSFTKSRLTVYCDMETDGGGWIVIQRRNASMGWVSFNRGWDDYVGGFGDLDGKVWIGLKNIHELTKRERMVLQLSTWNQSGNPTVKSSYDYFRISDASSRYALSRLGTISRGSGYQNPFHYGANSKYYFQTYDYYSGPSNCPYKQQNGWWYNYRIVDSRNRAHDSDCSEYSNLNGLHQPSGLRGTDQRGERLHWKTTSGVYNTFTNSEMKLRPHACTLR